MNTFIITTDYKTQYTNPIILKVGEVVRLGEEEKEEKWRGWIWAETNISKGWVPMHYLQMDSDKKTGLVIKDYSAKELDVKQGDEIMVLDSLFGWSWSRKLENGEEGWIPDEVIKR